MKVLLAVGYMGDVCEINDWIPWAAQNAAALAPTLIKLSWRRELMSRKSQSSAQQDRVDLGITCN